MAAARVGLCLVVCLCLCFDVCGLLDFCADVIWCCHSSLSWAFWACGYRMFVGGGFVVVGGCWVCFVRVLRLVQVVGGGWLGGLTWHELLVYLVRICDCLGFRSDAGGVV